MEVRCYFHGKEEPILKKLLASMTAAAFLMTGTAMAANQSKAPKTTTKSTIKAKSAVKSNVKATAKVKSKRSKTARTAMKRVKPTPKPQPTKKPWRRNTM